MGIHEKYMLVTMYPKGPVIPNVCAEQAAAAALEELRAQARAAGAVETAKAAGLSDESADQIRSKILGVK